MSGDTHHVGNEKAGLVEIVDRAIASDPAAAEQVRGGNMKRLASAVGEGSTAIAFVHKVLAE